jgi:hypothetical protein
MADKELRHTLGLCPATPLAAGGGGVLGKWGASVKGNYYGRDLTFLSHMHPTFKLYMP